jgi:acetoin utilization protein AcuC
VNDAAIAILELRDLGKRVAYVDIDAHHGDGVQEAFYDDPNVLTVSMHESGRTLFPWGGFEKETGDGMGSGYNINVPLEPDTDDSIFLFLFEEIVMDALELFIPDVVVGTFGTDTVATDPLTHLKMTNNGYIDAIEMLHRRFPGIVALGGGGYNMDDVVRGWTMLWAELAGRDLGQGYGGAIGGVLLGDSSIEGSDLRDMRIYTTGPEAERIRAASEKTVAWYRNEIRDRLTSSG